MVSRAQQRPVVTGRNTYFSTPIYILALLLQFLWVPETMAQNDGWDDIYTESVRCDITRQGNFNTVYGYCQWPRNLSNPAKCVADISAYTFKGQKFLCKASERGPSHPDEVQLNHAPDKIYSVVVNCSEVQPSLGDVVFGYCNWPFTLSDPADCIPGPNSLFGDGLQFFCKANSSHDDGSPTEEVQLTNAPEKIYTVEVHCTNVTQSFGKFSGDCDWPLFSSRDRECIEDKSKVAWGNDLYLLCKP